MSMRSSCRTIFANYPFCDKQLVRTLLLVFEDEDIRSYILSQSAALIEALCADTPAILDLLPEDAEFVDQQELTRVVANLADHVASKPATQQSGLLIIFVINHL